MYIAGGSKLVLKKNFVRSMSKGLMFYVWIIAAAFNAFGYFLEITNFGANIHVKPRITVFSVVVVLSVSALTFIVFKNIFTYQYYTSKKDRLARCFFDISVMTGSIYIAFDVFISKYKNPASVSAIVILAGVIINIIAYLIYSAVKKKNEAKEEKKSSKMVFGASFFICIYLLGRIIAKTVGDISADAVNILLFACMAGLFALMVRQLCNNLHEYRSK